MNNNGVYNPNIADVLYGSYIRYDRLYEMSMFAFRPEYGERANIFIDVKSILKSLYDRGHQIMVKDSCVIASCIINLAIHLRAYFETRHRVSTKVFIVYGEARPDICLRAYPRYNEKNILTEDSNPLLKALIKDNLKMIEILCPYLHDFFYIEDLHNEFSVITSSLINRLNESSVPSIVYSKDIMSYQLVAFKPRTFLFRPKKKFNEDCSWVVTKSTLYNAYRYGELGITRQLETTLNVKMFSIYLTIAGVKSRSIESIKNGNTTVKFLEQAVANNIFSTGYNSSAIFCTRPNPFETLFYGTNVDPNEVMTRFSVIDLLHNTMLYESSLEYKEAAEGIINLYNPDEVRHINNTYFQEYPLDLNRV